MKVAMIPIQKVGYSTRALRPTYMSERYARIFERSKKFRRMTEEELAQIKKKPVVAAQVVTPESKAGPKINIDPSAGATTKLVISDEPAIEPESELQVDEVGAATTRRRRLRKPQTSEE